MSVRRASAPPIMLDPISQRSPMVDGWERIPKVTIPACDLCPRVATWRHPSGLYRCGVCPKPTTRKTDR